MIAVLTADVVHSTKLDDLQYQAMIRTLKLLLGTVATQTDVYSDIYRGDGFQAVFTNPKDAVRLSLVIKLGLLTQIPDLSVSLTQSLAVGDYTSLNTKTGESNGPVFVASGRGLEQAKKGTFNIELSTENTQGFDIATAFLDHQLNQLSIKQASVGYLYLLHGFPEQNQLATELKMTRQNVATHLKRGAFDLIKAYIQKYEGLFTQSKSDSSTPPTLHKTIKSKK